MADLPAPGSDAAIAGYALIVDGREVKRFPTKLQCAIEAYDRRLVLTWRAGFGRDLRAEALRPGVSIVPILPTPKEPEHG